ncbi:hypothetical protein [Maricaulis maris]|uniref:Uncharacterized protein n=1 Tax=Maricaulis maris TaxID=74318 RepID=A0A495D4V7_9PROT|nr:hypothetical protein [Maricaulis maris]RKQ96429.1 hypothetical protein C7435_1759 [Maricaulis maris]
MRRRVRRKVERSAPLPVRHAWMTTWVIMLAAFFWYLIHLFSTVSYNCREFYDWWFDREMFGMATLQWTSLYAVTLALWFCVLIVRPKRERIPVWIRFFQGKMIFWIVLISVFQWGMVRPQSDEARIYAWFQDEVAGWPVINWFFRGQSMPFVEIYDTFNGVEIDYEDPLFDEAEALQAEYERTFRANMIPRRMGMYRGELECEATARIDKAWERAFTVYFKRWREEQPVEAPTGSVWDMPLEPEPDEADR